MPLYNWQDKETDQLLASRPPTRHETSPLGEGDEDHEEDNIPEVPRIDIQLVNEGNIVEGQRAMHVDFTLYRRLLMEKDNKPKGFA